LAAHLFEVQVSVLVQMAQAAPPLPQAEPVSPGTHMSPEQQPVGQVLGVQVALVFWQEPS